jgi:hypothetical protein
MRNLRCFSAILALAATSLVAEGIADQLKWNFQDRVRGEKRRNVYDFDSSRSAVTDDSWLLHRIRLGVEWLKVTAQGLDVRESFSKRADIPLQNSASSDADFAYLMLTLNY